VNEDRLAEVIGSAALRIALRSGRRRRPAQPVDRDLRLTVTAVRAEAPDVAGLTLARPDGADLPAWRPGAHLDLVLPSGLLRQYSLCGDPDDRASYRIAVRRLATGSAEVHGLAPGTEITARGPRNAFPLAAAPGYLFLAGGIGITPLAPMARAAAVAGVPWRLVHTGRDRASLPLSAALDPAHVLLRPDDEHGGPPPVAALVAEQLAALPRGSAVYCCGPPPMIDAVRRAVPAGHRLHSERFSPPPVRGGRAFTVELARTGRTVDVPADRSALDAVQTVLPAVPYSCRQGFCGTCHVRLLAGRTERDTSAPGSMALCVARAEGDRLVLDL
jgi:ferredoxin-NADP reductase